MRSSPEGPRAKREKHRRVPSKAGEEAECAAKERAGEGLGDEGARSDVGPLSGDCME